MYRDGRRIEHLFALEAAYRIYRRSRSVRQVQSAMGLRVKLSCLMGNPVKRLPNVDDRI